MQRQATSSSASSAGGSGGSTGTPGRSSGSPSSAQDPYVRSLTALESSLLEKLHELQLLTAENQQLTQRYTQLELQVGISSQQLLHMARTFNQAEAAPDQPTEAPAAQTDSGFPHDEQTTSGLAVVASTTSATAAGEAAGKAAAATAAAAAQPEGERSSLELGTLQRVLQYEEEVQQLLESIGAALPQLGAGAIQVKDLLAGLDLGGATCLTLEQLVAAHQAFVQQASLLLHGAGDLAGGATPALRQLVSQHLRLLMAAFTAQPLLLWRMASMDLESRQAADMVASMYRYVLLNMCLSWEQLDWLAGAYARHEPQLQTLTAQRVELLEALAAATASGDVASEAQAVASVQANVRQWNHVQSSIMVHLAAVSCWGQVARLLVSSYPQFPLAIYVSKAARDLFHEVTSGQQASPTAAGPATTSAKAQWAAMCAAAAAGAPSS